jgi:hypothetical protein
VARSAGRKRTDVSQRAVPRRASARQSLIKSAKAPLIRRTRMSLNARRGAMFVRAEETRLATKLIIHLS